MEKPRAAANQDRFWKFCQRLTYICGIASLRSGLGAPFSSSSNMRSTALELLVILLASQALINSSRVKISRSQAASYQM